MENIETQPNRDSPSQFSDRVTPQEIRTCVIVSVLVMALIVTAMFGAKFKIAWEERQSFHATGYDVCSNYDGKEFTRSEVMSIINDHTGEGLTFRVINEVGEDSPFLLEKGVVAKHRTYRCQVEKDNHGEVVGLIFSEVKNNK